MLDDEQHLVVVRWVGAKLLCAEQSIQLQVARVGGASCQVYVNRLFKLSPVHPEASKARELNRRNPGRTLARTAIVQPDN